MRNMLRRLRPTWLPLQRKHREVDDALFPEHRGTDAVPRRKGRRILWERRREGHGPASDHDQP